MKKEYVCPMCGSNNKKVSEMFIGGDPNTGICGNCGYSGIFVIKEKIKTTQNLT